MATPKAGASTSRSALMKEDQKTEEVETKIVSKWSNIGDTNLGNFSTKKFREVPYIGKPSPVARRIIEMASSRRPVFLQPFSATS